MNKSNSSSNISVISLISFFYRSMKIYYKLFPFTLSDINLDYIIWVNLFLVSFLSGEYSLWLGIILALSRIFELS